MSILSSFLLFLFTYAPVLHFRVPTTGIAVNNRRTLHQPFFPSPAPPSLPPAHPPSSLPKQPSSSTVAATPTVRPFFPFYPSPPPPPSSSSTATTAATYPANPATSLPTFPANISSIVASPARGRASPGSKLVAAISLPLLAAAALVFSLILFLLRRRSSRRRRGGDKDARSDSLRFFAPDTTASDGRKLSPTNAASSSSGTAAAGAEFLYLGTLVSSRGGGGRVNEGSASANAGSAAGGGSPYRKLGSPELHPLPPLPRQCREVEECRSSAEEYYSPKDSPAAKCTAGEAAALGKKKAALGVEMERWGSRSSTLSTPSYDLSSNVASSPSRSSPAASSPPLPPPLKPPPLLRPPTPSPPKRRPPSHSPPTSPPPEVACVKKVGTLQAPGQNLWSPRKIGDFAKNQTVVGRKPPPPPPPPLRSAYKDGQNAKTPPLLQPPVLVPPKPIETRSISTTAAPPAEMPKTSDVSADFSDNSRPKLKPLHWDKVRASSDREMVWDQLKSSSFQLNEEMIETLFVSSATNKASNGVAGGKSNPLNNQESRVLDPKKSQNIAILLRALNITKEEVCEALLEGRAESLGNGLLEALTKMMPSKEEEFRLQEYKDDSPFKLGPAESFLKAVLDIPFAFKRVEAMLYIVNFDPEVNHLRTLFVTLETACEELRCNRMFRKLLGAVLKTGNRMNVGTNRGDAQAFKLDTLLKLVDIKGTDGKTTLLHFVVQEITRAEGMRIFSANVATSSTPQSTLAELESRKHGLHLVSGLGDELANVKKAAAMDSDMLSSYVLKLSGGIGKVQEVVRLNDAILNEHGRQFHDAMLRFLTKAEHDILEIQDEESKALSLVKEITEYFHGDSSREEAHPFRIFTVVRDFLATLDHVCKEVEKNIESTISSTRQCQLPANQASSSAFPRFQATRSSDEESSSSF